ncbi:AMP-binding protein [Wenzhouxiangella sp. XN79A]|uniref:AMP-binding protein n=1 Tax=Wenzhouxiangella sp. XN79A TaxID=2724193 RepID=UPI00144A7B46|nr:AMP-binding protein [Wenzhouxiangella sp. XN79A]NKI35712.1 AMP-binding protein [Wenzhouxiangella sp. XN79A]
MLHPLQQLILDRASTTPDALYLSQPIDREWITWSWAQAVDEAQRVAAMLLAEGFEPGDRIGLISKNCAHWIIADMAMILSGLVSVPIYPTANASTIRGILEHSGCRAVFIGKLEHPDEQRTGIPDEVLTIAMPYPGVAGDRDWNDWIETAGPAFQPVPRADDDLATLLYTSGSTGEPKGAMHSYGNFLFVGKALGEAVGVRDGDRVLSYLPLSHCTERAYVEAASFHGGTTLYFVETLDTFMDDLAHARPTLFGSVPRLWKKFQLGVLEKLPQEKLDRLLRIPFVNGLIRRKVKKGLGIERADWFASGSAPIAPALLEWWDRLGVTICEGWGMTETFAYGTQIGRGETPRFGSISRALPEVELRTSDDGELLIRCPCLMQGYYKADEATQASFVDGWFRTGDRAAIDSEGWVRITGRLKEVFKTTKGKYIAPVPIESLLARNAMIEMACVLGDGRDQPIALIQLPEHGGVPLREVRTQLVETLDAVNAELEPHERLERLIVIREHWTVDNDLLTPTLKIRRPQIEARYRDAVAESSGRVFIAGDHDHH